ncbi:MAG: hypothetical protein Q8N89_12965 [Azonexus sp.]|nr:hypothetical protein [Azonexus sp.]
MRTLVVTLVGVLVLAGCATTPLPASQAKPAPKERIFAFQDKTATNSATAVVTRDDGFLGSGCYYGFWINGVLAARLDVAETSSFFVEPGEHVLRVGIDPQGKGLCSAGSGNWTQRETILRANEPKFFRLSLDLNGKADIERSE